MSTATVSEYVCDDCGTLLTHSNPITLQSMKEVHDQLCVVKRQKSRAAQVAAPAAPKPAAGMPAAAAAPTPAPAIAAPAAPAAGGNTTISLSGTGTSYAKVDGPIDVGFKSKRQIAGQFQGINVWGPLDAPGQLGIWGTNVCIDFDICVADGACIEACPVNVYEWLDTPGHPASDKKAFMVREKDCIFCLACENVCPPQAVKIFQK
ncbi:MAG: 4Fe-4S dicluster domain-containing protein [Nitrososphaera sp.]|uniref:4Fe-4S dicluster domain-containing protein n=1 Tax=Nitrososphaera sp. TaxID=1971748 RepID=UPI003D6EAB14